MEYSYKAELERKNLIEDWARYTAERLQKSLQRKKVGVTGDLNYSILYSLVGAANGDLTSVRHEFNYYGKLIDMGVGRGQKLESVKGNRDMYVLTGHRARAPKKWFSKTYYSETLELVSMLSLKYGEQIPHMVKEEITQTLNMQF